MCRGNALKILKINWNFQYVLVWSGKKAGKAEKFEIIF